jgi:hypothetical protein
VAYAWRRSGVRGLGAAVGVGSNVERRDGVDHERGDRHKLGVKLFEPPEAVVEALAARTRNR